VRQSLTPAQRRQRGSISANSWYAEASQEQINERASTARANSPASLAYWERKVDPDGHLPPEERTRRATKAKQVYFQRLAFLSSKARARGGDAA